MKDSLKTDSMKNKVHEKFIEDLELSLLVSPSLYERIRKQATKKGLSNSEYIKTLLLKVK